MPPDQDEMGTEGVIVLDDAADTKRVRVGTRSQTSKTKRQEFEESTAQNAAFDKTKIQLEMNTKETWVLSVICFCHSTSYSLQVRAIFSQTVNYMCHMFLLL